MGNIYSWALEATERLNMQPSMLINSRRSSPFTYPVAVLGVAFNLRPFFFFSGSAFLSEEESRTSTSPAKKHDAATGKRRKGPPCSYTLSAPRFLSNDQVMPMAVTGRGNAEEGRDSKPLEDSRCRLPVCLHDIIIM